MSKDHLVIFDTTLRDGEQSPGASMTKDEKLRIAKMLERLRVDVIEAGFAIASDGDYEAVKAIADSIKDSRVCSLARAVKTDIERAGKALKNAYAGRIHTFIATSPIHMEYKLKMGPDQVIERAVDSVQFARNFCSDVEFSCEDASRSELEFMYRIIEAVIDAGAGTINIPDTVGYSLPEQYGAIMQSLIQNIPNSDKAIFSVHCHNDLGLAVANSLAAVQCGARQVECTINGLGERAGNASLEELVMAVRTRKDAFDVQTRIDTTQIIPISRLVSGITGFSVQPNKAIVGVNAFAHESGIHQDGVLKHRETYEIMSAQDIGLSTNRLVLGKHSGRAAFRSRLEKLGITYEDVEGLNAVFQRFKNLADKKHEIFDEDLLALANNAVNTDIDNKYQLLSLEARVKSGEKPVATLSIEFEGVIKEAHSDGSGPVDATFKAIENIANSGAILQIYSVNAVTEGTDSQGEVTVRLEKEGYIVNGQGADTDIVMASAKAYINALNILASGVKPIHPQASSV